MGWRDADEPETLRSCSDEYYEWLHPGSDFPGDFPGSRHWRDMPCWLRNDLNNDLDALNATRLNKANIFGEAQVALEDAEDGLLEQDVPGSTWKRHRDVGRTTICPEVIELRLPKPFDIGKIRARGRIYYAEPSSAPYLVSLGGQVKDVDHPNETTIQNERIETCDGRRREWERRYKSGFEK